MVNRYSIKQKILTFILSMLVMLSVLPVSTLASGISDGISSLASSVKESEPPTSLDGVTIPTVTKNPYNVDVFVDAYPIYNNTMYNFLDGYYRNYVRDYGTHDICRTDIARISRHQSCRGTTISFGSIAMTIW